MGCSQGGMVLDKEAFSRAEFQLVVSQGVSVRMAGCSKAQTKDNSHGWIKQYKPTILHKSSTTMTTGIKNVEKVPLSDS